MCLNKKGVLLPLKIPKNFYQDLNKIKGNVTLSQALLIGFSHYKCAPFEISVDRTIDKSASEYKRLYPMQSTSLSIPITEYSEIEDIVNNEKDVNYKLLTFLYLFCQHIQPGYYHSFFDQELFEQKFKFCEQDYYAAYQYCKVQAGKDSFSQREYQQYRLSNQPSLYKVQRKYGSFKEFIKKMEMFIEGK